MVLYPILSRYASPIPFVTLSEFCLILFTVISIFESNKKYFLVREIVVFLTYLCFCFFWAWFCTPGGKLTDAIGTLLRLFFLYAILSFLSKRYFEIEWAEKALINVSFFVALYGIIQTIASLFGKILTTYIPLLPIMGTNNLDDEIRLKASYGLAFRCQSILNEPAALCCYLILPIILCLFVERQNNRKNQKAKAIFFSFTSLISMSSTGIIMVLLLWLMYFVRRINSRKELLNRVILVLGAGVFGGIFLVTSGIWKYFVNRTFQGNIGLEGLQNGTRFYAINDMLGASHSIGGILFGGGMAQTADYLPGWARIYRYLGIIGFFLMVWMLYRFYKRCNQVGKKIIIAYFVLNIGTEILLGPFAIYYLSFVLGNMTISINRNNYRCCKA